MGVRKPAQWTRGQFRVLGTRRKPSPCCGRTPGRDSLLPRLFENKHSGRHGRRTPPHRCWAVNSFARAWCADPSSGEALMALRYSLSASSVWPSVALTRPSSTITGASPGDASSARRSRASACGKLRCCQERDGTAGHGRGRRGHDPACSPRSADSLWPPTDTQPTRHRTSRAKGFRWGRLRADARVTTGGPRGGEGSRGVKCGIEVPVTEEACSRGRSATRLWYCWTALDMQTLGPAPVAALRWSSVVYFPRLSDRRSVREAGCNPFFCQCFLRVTPCGGRGGWGRDGSTDRRMRVASEMGDRSSPA